MAAMPGPPPIAVERLVKIYKTIPAVDGISFTLAPGSITGLLGGNGAVYVLFIQKGVAKFFVPLGFIWVEPNGFLESGDGAF